jgi:hypothetical protein
MYFNHRHELQSKLWKPIPQQTAEYLAKYTPKKLCDWDFRLKPQNRKDYLLFRSEKTQ